MSLYSSHTSVIVRYRIEVRLEGVTKDFDVKRNKLLEVNGPAAILVGVAPHGHHPFLGQVQTCGDLQQIRDDVLELAELDDAVAVEVVSVEGLL